MEIEPNYEALARLELEQPREERSALQWVLIIAAGVLLANAITAFAGVVYVRWQAEQAAAELRSLTEKLRAQGEEQRAEAQARQAQQSAASARVRRAQEQHRAAIESAQRTCVFWTQQVASENITKNRRMRDEACAYARELRAKTP